MTRDDLINHILRYRAIDEDRARDALLWYHDLLPWMNLLDGIKKRLT